VLTSIDPPLKGLYSNVFFVIVFSRAFILFCFECLWLFFVYCFLLEYLSDLIFSLLSVFLCFLCPSERKYLRKSRTTQSHLDVFFLCLECILSWSTESLLGFFFDFISLCESKANVTSEKKLLAFFFCVIVNSKTEQI